MWSHGIRIAGRGALHSFRRFKILWWSNLTYYALPYLMTFTTAPSHFLASPEREFRKETKQGRPWWDIERWAWRDQLLHHNQTQQCNNTFWEENQSSTSSAKSFFTLWPSIRSWSDETLVVVVLEQRRSPLSYAAIAMCKHHITVRLKSTAK